MTVHNYILLFILENGTKWTEQEDKEDPKILEKKVTERCQVQRSIYSQSCGHIMSWKMRLSYVHT